MGVKVRNLSGFLDVERELSPTTSLIVYIKKAMRSPEIIFDRTFCFLFFNFMIIIKNLFTCLAKNRCPSDLPSYHLINN